MISVTISASCTEDGGISFREPLRPSEVSSKLRSGQDDESDVEHHADVCRSGPGRLSAVPASARRQRPPARVRPTPRWEVRAL